MNLSSLHLFPPILSHYCIPSSHLCLIPPPTNPSRPHPLWFRAEGPANLRILNWNVNGLRAALGKGLDKRLTELGLPDVVCLSEIKAEPEQIDFDFTSLGE